MNEQKNLVSDEEENGTSSANNESKRSTVVENATSTAQSKTNFRKKKKKFSLLAYCLVACVVIPSVLMLLAIITKKSLFNNILLVTGLLEIGTAYVLYRIVLHKERFTCPQCGTKRVHHRHFEHTTTHITSKPSRPGGGYIGYRKIEFSHHYTDTYTCPECDEQLVEQVKKMGGSFTEYEDGRIEDKRIDPQEF